MVQNPAPEWSSPALRPKGLTLNRLELVEGECGLGRQRPCVRWPRLTVGRAGACKDWSHPSRAVHLNHARPGRAEWNWHPFWRGERLRPRPGMFVGVDASRTAARRSGQADAGGSEDRE